MTPYEHIWAWAKSLKIEQMNEFIEKYEFKDNGQIVIWHKGISRTHAVSDVLEAVKYNRDEYRKDQRMTQKEQ